MQITLNEFLKLESNNTPKLLLINASEECTPLIIYALDNLKNKFGGASNIIKFNVDRFFNFQEIKQILNSKSLFDENNYIELNYKTKPTLEHQAILNDIYPMLSSQNTLVITTEKLNKRDLSSKWVNSLSQYGIILNLDESNFTTLINHALSPYEITLEKDALQLLLEQNQANANQIIQELTKLTLSCPKGSKLNIEDIKTHTTNNSQFNIYKLSNAYLSGNLLQCLKILDNIYQAAEDAILIHWMLNEDLKKLIKIKAKLKVNNNVAQVIREIGVWGDAVNLLPIAQSRLSYNDLILIFELNSQLEFIIKGVKTGNIKQHVTSILKHLCNKEAT
ncbi:MAG: DNA polymerase III subunit delta [Proteobacteria bacterium]|jgi:DNA polymerase-3 subunit delta|nr:DNA polymerase III subunit delta [Pseudomonadota bacterium]